MEIGAAAAGVSAGVNALWGYNRKNFLFDREQRQKNEYTVLDWRCKQAALWRDDVKDIIGLTEKKMDTYTIVSALQLGMCVALFTEGRLEPGTPPWLLHFYMLTLTAGFLYLLMSVWLAMHASIVAQCSSVRLLTQFVRLPVPTWQELENMRTYAQSFEQIKGKNMLRVPFFGQGSKTVVASEPDSTHGQTESQEADKAKDFQKPLRAADPWGWEVHGHHRDIYELQQVPVAMRRHIGLAQRAAEQYKCFDAFARVAMTFGTNQLLQAITYYCLGYVSVQDGAPWAAWCVGAIMGTIAVAMLHLDISLKRREQLTAQVLVLAGPVCTSCATWLWARHGEDASTSIMVLLPIAYAAHAMWLLWALQACGVERTPCGSMLPTRFRAVLYLDVFGWNSSDQDPQRRAGADSGKAQPSPDGYRQAPVRRLSFEGDATGVPEDVHVPDSPDTPDSPRDMSQLHEDLCQHIALWQSEKVQQVMDDQEKARVNELVRRFQKAAGMGELAGANSSKAVSETPATCRSSGLDATSTTAGLPGSPTSRSPWVKLHGYSDFGMEAPYLYDPDSGEVANLGTGQPGDPEGPNQNQHVRTITFAEEEVERYCNHTQEVRSRVSSAGQTRAVETAEQSTAGSAGAAATFMCCSALGGDHFELKLRDASLPLIKEEPGFERPRGAEPGAQPSRPCGTIPTAPAHAFHPTSFLPSPHQSVRREREDEGEIVTGHDRVKPGELPWQIFRSATLLLVALWGVGLAFPLSGFREVMTKPLIAEIHVKGEGKSGVEHFAVGTDPSGLPEYIPEPFDDSIHDLPEGELIEATWPSHSGFQPRALSSGLHGKQLVVADDFGMYAGQLFIEQLPTAQPRALRGGTGAVPIKVASVRFRHAPPCTALEGQALKDISVVCEEGTSPLRCRALVLRTHGMSLVECPLQGSAKAASPSAAAAARPSGPVRGNRSSLTWEISSDWLQGSRETVESVAVNNECLGPTSHRAEVGCVVVGTTSGRIVQLRGHLTNDTRLVPERAVQQWSQAVEHGSLHIFPNGCVVALHKRTGSIEAFDAVKGKSIGQWRLPQRVKWLMLSGGGDHLYVLGRENHTEVKLYRFPAPRELQSPARDAALPFGDRGF